MPVSSPMPPSLALPLLLFLHALSPLASSSAASSITAAAPSPVRSSPSPSPPSFPSPPTTTSLLPPLPPLIPAYVPPPASLWRVGMRVESMWKNGWWYRGTIRGIHLAPGTGEQRFHVSFDEGDSINNATAMTTVPFRAHPGDRADREDPHAALERFLHTLDEATMAGAPRLRRRAAALFHDRARARPGDTKALYFAAVLGRASHVVGRGGGSGGGGGGGSGGSGGSIPVTDDLMRRYVAQEFDRESGSYDLIAEDAGSDAPRLVAAALRAHALAGSESRRRRGGTGDVRAVRGNVGDGGRTRGSKTHSVGRLVAANGGGYGLGSSAYNTVGRRSGRWAGSDSDSDGAAPDAPLSAARPRGGIYTSSTAQCGRASVLPFWAPGVWQRGSARAPLTVLDIGSGTGRCAAAVQGLVGSEHVRMTGVDLSHRMVSLSTGRGVYDWLQEGHVNSFLDQHRDARGAPFHVVVACDVLMYLPDRDLRGLLRRVRQHLRRPDGVFAFTVEEARAGELGRGGGVGDKVMGVGGGGASRRAAVEGRVGAGAWAGAKIGAGAGVETAGRTGAERVRPPPPVLRYTGRVAHAPAYIEAALERAGLQVAARHRVVLHWEWQRPEWGIVYVVQHAAGVS